MQLTLEETEGTERRTVTLAIAKDDIKAHSVLKLAEAAMLHLGYAAGDIRKAMAEISLENA